MSKKTEQYEIVCDDDEIQCMYVWAQALKVHVLDPNAASYDTKIAIMNRIIAWIVGWAKDQPTPPETGDE